MAVCTTFNIPLIYCLAGGYIIPTTFDRNQNNHWNDYELDSKQTNKLTNNPLSFPRVNSTWPFSSLAWATEMVLTNKFHQGWWPMTFWSKQTIETQHSLRRLFQHQFVIKKPRCVWRHSGWLQLSKGAVGAGEDQSAVHRAPEMVFFFRNWLGLKIIECKCQESQVSTCQD